MRLLLSSALGLTVLFVAASGAAAKEDPEVVAYVKKNGWSLYTDTRIWDGKRLIYLVVQNSGKVFEDVSLSADDYRMIARSKTVQVLDLRQVKNTSDDGLKQIAAIRQLEGIIVKGEAVTDAGVQALAKCRALEVISLLFTKKITDAGVKELAALPKLRFLYLMGMTLDGSALEPFAGSKTLESLTLEYVEGLTDDAARRIARLPNLIELKIVPGFGEKKMTTAGIKVIVDARLPAKFDFDKKLLDDDLLESLVKKGWLYGPTPPGLREKKPATPGEVRVISLDGSQVTDKGMRSLLNCTNAASLHLEGTAVTDETLTRLSGFKKLEWVSLRGTKVTGSGLSAMTGLRIKHVGMQECTLCEEAFKALGTMPALGTLWLSDAKMKAEWLQHLAAVPKLKELNLSGTECDDASVKHLAAMANLQDLTLNQTKLGDKGFQQLLALPKLRSLYVDGTMVSKEVYQKAKKEHPKLRLFFYRYDQ